MLVTTQKVQQMALSRRKLCVCVSYESIPILKHAVSSTAKGILKNFEVYEEGRVVGKVNQETHFTLFARDSCKYPIRVGSLPAMQIMLRHEWQGLNLFLTDALHDNQDGSGTVYFTATHSGSYVVKIRAANSLKDDDWFYLGDIHIEP